MKKTSKHTPSSTRANEPDGIAMLTADHKKVKGIFKQFEKLRGQEGAEEERTALVQQVCNELKVHAQIEEEIFYPAARAAIDDDDLMDEAEVEHAGAKELIEQLEAMQPDDDLYDAKVTVLGEQIEHHAKEEEDEMFPRVKKAKVDTAALGAQMSRRKMALMEEMGMSADGEDGTLVSGNGKNKRRSSSISADAHR